MPEPLPKTAKAPSRRFVKYINPMHDRFDGASVTYQLEWVLCGKPKCKKKHGPYWYAYWTSGGRTRTLYIGKKLRPAADAAAALIERKQAKRCSDATPKRRNKLP